MPEEPGLADVIAEQRELLSRLRAVVEAKDAENQVLRAELAGLDLVVLVAVERAGPTAVDALLSHQDNRGRLRDL